jgi:hypothetical protein
MVDVLQKPPTGTVYDSAYWKARAEENRAIAKHLTDLRAKEMMLRIIVSYDRLAELAEARAWTTLVPK